MNTYPQQRGEGRIPRVSICVPTRNCAQFLVQAVSSALDQGYHDLEVVVVDNCSTDNTEPMMRDIAIRDVRVRYHRNDHDLGLVGNLNRCLRLARGEYIKYLLADDVLMPGCVDAMSKVLDADHSVALVTGGRFVIDEEGKRLGFRRYSRFSKTVAGTEAIQRCLFSANHVGEPTAVMFRRRDAVRGFRDDYPQLTDMEMWFHLMECGRLASLPVPVCGVRVHAAQITNSNIRSGQLVEDNVRLFEEFRRKYYIKPSCWCRFSHKIRMAYRIWMSRGYMETEKRRFVIMRYSSRFAYYGLMPAISTGLRVTRRIRGLLARWRGKPLLPAQAGWHNQDVKR